MVGCPADPVGLARAARADTLVLNYRYVDRDLVDAAHRQGIEVIVWNIDDPEILEPYLAMNLDAICTNRPREIIDYLKNESEVRKRARVTHRLSARLDRAPAERACKESVRLGVLQPSSRRNNCEIMDDATQTLTGQLAAAAREAADRTAMIYREGDTVREYTYGRLYRDSLAVAGWLQAQGVEKGDRVAILLENRPEWPMSYFGTLLAGAVAVPLDPVSRWDHIQYALEQTRARIIFTFPQAPLSQLQELPFLEKIVVVGRNRGIRRENHQFRGKSWKSSGSEAGLPAVAPRRPGLHHLYLGHHRASQRGDAHPQEFLRQLPGHRPTQRHPAG